jgi:hypothetical protein
VQVKDSKAQYSNTNNQMVLRGLKLKTKLIFVPTEFLVATSEKGTQSSQTLPNMNI